MNHQTQGPFYDELAEVVRLVELAPASASETLYLPPFKRGWAGLLVRLTLLIVLPTVVSVLYFDILAIDRYVSEASFVLRKPNALAVGTGGGGGMESSSSGQSSSSGGIGSDIGGSGLISDDSYAVRDFILSRDAMKLLEDKGGFREALARASGDPFWQFPGLLTGRTNEDLFELYLSMVSVEYDTTSDVTTLKVEAFDPSDAQRLADTLISGAESLMDHLNERARADAISVAKSRIDEARGEAMRALDKLTEFRAQQHFVDPTLLSKTVLDTITELSLRLVEASAELDVTTHASPTSPQVPLLHARVAALKAEIDRERAALAGGDGSLAPQISQYERLALQRDFAEDSLMGALTALEIARAQAERQEVYLDRVVQPNAADKPAMPRRVLWPLGVFLIGAILFWLFRPDPPTLPRRS